MMEFPKEIWVSNGSTVGSRMMTDTEPGAIGSDPPEVIVYGPKLLVAATNSMIGSEVWVADSPEESRLKTIGIDVSIPGAVYNQPLWFYLEIILISPPLVAPPVLLKL